MKITRLAPVLTITFAGALALSACGSGNNDNAGSSKPSNCPTGSLAGQGSTFQQNIEKQWISDYASKCSGFKVDYQGVGSGAGIQAFNSNQVDYAGSDSLMKTDEQAAADTRCGSPAIHIPVTAGGIVLVYNLPGVDKLNLSAKTLAGIFQGTIKTWDDAAIKADNSDATLPSTTIAAVHRSDASGTTDVFSKFLSSQAGADWKLGTGKDIVFPTSIQAAKGSDGVTNLVKSTEGGLAYTELSFAVANNLKTAKITGAGEAVEATGDTVAKALASATVDESKGDLRVTLDFGTKDGYPISAVSYAIVCSKGNKNAAGLKAFLGYAVGDGQKNAADIGFAPLPSSISGKVSAAVAAIS